MNLEASMKKQIGIQLPRQANPEEVTIRYSLELEALAPIADIIEVSADTPEEFAQGVRGMDAIITSWGFRIDADLINQLEQCVVIGVGSVGVDMVDIEAATAAGIVVTNVPDVFIEEVADHAMMLLLASARRMKAMDRMSATDQWWSGRPLLNHIPRMMGQTLGLFAYGNVARCTARRAKAFGMHVIAYDPYVSELVISEDGVEPVSFDELLARSDYLSVHAPHNFIGLLHFRFPRIHISVGRLHRIRHQFQPHARTIACFCCFLVYRCWAGESQKWS